MSSNHCKMMVSGILHKILQSINEFILSFDGKSVGTGILHLTHSDAVQFNRVWDIRRMHYTDKMIRFQHCLYKLAGGQPPKLLSGTRGTLNRNFYITSSNINIAIPITLRNMSSNHCKIMYQIQKFCKVLMKIILMEKKNLYYHLMGNL